MALSDILKLLSKPKKRAAADLRAALAEVDPKALEAEVDRLEAERRRLLVHGSDAEVLEIGIQITAANLACERGAAAIAELTRLIDEADAREAEAAIEGTIEEADKLAREIAATSGEIDEAATKLSGLLGTFTMQSGALRGLNSRLEKAGRPVTRPTDIAVLRRRIMERIK